MGLASRVIEFLKKRETSMTDLGGRIEATLKEINGHYRPGLIKELMPQLNRWARLLTLEDGINKAALAGDEGTLIGALAAYRSFFSEALQVENSKRRVEMQRKESITLPLFKKVN